MWIERVRQASISTFEEAAFCLVEGVDGEHRAAGTVRGAVRFEGSRSGLLLVEVESATAVATTENMLGLADNTSPELQTDALREIANMICGQILSGFDEEGGVFQLRPTEQEPPQRAVPVAEVNLELDVGFARVALWVDPAEAES